MSVTDHVAGIVHEPTQVHEDEAALDLTAAEIYEVTDPGRVDFGGGELEDATLEPHDRVWRTEDDEYQWWHLDAGRYVLQFNETVEADERLVLQPRGEMLERGASHPTLHGRSIERVPLSVGGGGLRVKENARVSTLLVP